MTFIPLQSIRVKPVIERLRSLGGTARLVFDILQYPSLYISPTFKLPYYVISMNSKTCFVLRQV
jgi:structural maintenance of chromosome 1